MADLWDGNVTALHHYWLKPKATVVGPAPVWAWPCSPTILGTQGLGLYGPYTFSTRFIGGHNGAIVSGASTGEPCEHVIVASIDGSSINPLVQVDALPLTAAWTVECRIGYTSALVPTSMDFLRLAGTPDIRVRYTPGSGTLELRYAGATAVQVTHTLAADVFHHIALTCNVGTYTVWVNGVAVLTYSGTGLTGNSNLTLSTVFGSNRPIFIAGVRLWQAVAYTAPFTPPTQLTL